MTEVSQDCSEPAWRQRLNLWNHSMSCRDRIAARMALTTFHTCCSPGDFLPLRTVKAVIERVQEEGRVWWRLVSFFSWFSFWETRLVTSERSKGSEWEKKESLRGWRGQCSDSGWTSKLYSLERKRSRRHRAVQGRNVLGVDAIKGAFNPEHPPRELHVCSSLNSWLLFWKMTGNLFLSAVWSSDEVGVKQFSGQCSLSKQSGAVSETLQSPPSADTWMHHGGGSESGSIGRFIQTHSHPRHKNLFWNLLIH